MSTQEFSAEFDVLFNNVTSNQAPGLNEYEKSVFLTKAQAQLVNEYFNQRTDGFGGGFDGGQRRQYDFSEIIKTENLFNVNKYYNRVTLSEKLDKRSEVFIFPQDYFLAVTEIVSDTNRQYPVMPINYLEYQRLMAKPYNFPVKRGVWRIITNSKACNFIHEDAEGNCIENLNGVNEYKILTTWTDGNRSLNITIVTPFGVWDSTDNTENLIVYNNTIKFKSVGYPNGIYYYCKIVVNKSLSDNNTQYNLKFTIYVNGSPDDGRLLEIIKDGFRQLKESEYWNINNNIVDAAKCVDCFEQSYAPSNLTTFRGTGSPTSSSGGRTFKSKIIKLPLVEIIGKFDSNIHYQLKYISLPSPIILTDLEMYGTDLSIEGIKNATECKLPKETHQEILERAVTLAKIAWQGGTMTGAAQQ